ncbi:MoaD/ThiS family protein [Sulfuricaulis sp.]|jgi:molybdopterin synthase sulfur carrier subunit|uniref:MoaD/ThiS family protein n=1 Tax=Sulfuricaulis sp. TaxID=2003553 RepID=UPI00355A1812
MPQVVFTPNLQRHLACPPRAVAGRTVAAALQEVFADNPVLRGYVLDDQGQLRQHVAIFVDGRQINDRARLTDPVREASEVFVVQALSGG